MVWDNARRAAPWLLIMAGQALALSFVQADVAFDTRTDNDYIALVVEAENNSNKDERWVLTEPDTPEQEDDPDSNHSDQAVGQAYLELLPDIRVTHEDPFGPPTAAWFQAGTGPRAEYLLDFPEAGRYYVHVRAYSTGTEDNGLHIGLNGDFPDSGKSMQFCTAGQGWSWSGRQRDSGGQGPCGAQKTIWVTVEEPGEHTFMISAREDGFEIDRIMLIKDLSDNTRICKPNNADDIQCVNGSIENVDEVVDMQVLLQRHEEQVEEGDTEQADSDTTVDIDESVEVTAIVRNLDGYDTALDVVLSLTPDLGNDWQLQSMPEACVEQDGALLCELGQMTPSGPEGELELQFAFEPLRSGELPIDAAITTSSVDDGVNNDTAGLVILVDDAASLSYLMAQIAEPTGAWQSDSQFPLSFTVVNAGPAIAEDVSVSLSMPSSLMVSSVPADCEMAGTFRCAFDQLDVDESRTIEVQISTAEAGLFSINLAATAANLDANSLGQTADTVIVTVQAQDTTPVDPGPDPDPDPDQEVEPDPEGNGGETPVENPGDGSEEEPAVSSKSSGSGFTSVWILSFLLLGVQIKLASTRRA